MTAQHVLTVWTSGCGPRPTSLRWRLCDPTAPADEKGDGADAFSSPADCLAKGWRLLGVPEMIEGREFAWWFTQDVGEGRR